MCVAAPLPTGDLAIGQAQSKSFVRTTVLLYTLNFERSALSTASVKLVMEDEKPPPLAVGRSPQAKLRVWIL